jgi:hypothetical protein
MVEVHQVAYYFSTRPNDKKPQKFAVWVALFFDTVATLANYAINYTVCLVHLAQAGTSR